MILAIIRPPVVSFSVYLGGVDFDTRRCLMPQGGFSEEEFEAKSGMYTREGFMSTSSRIGSSGYRLLWGLQGPKMHRERAFGLGGFRVAVPFPSVLSR